MFEFEDRMCPQCGSTFNALSLWDATVPCGRCSEQRYRERLERINADRSYTVTSIGGACPTQAHGRTADDRPFYFRARHGEWSLELGEPGWPTDYPDWPSQSIDLAEGDDPSGGWMEDGDVLAVLDAHLPRRLLIQ